MKKKVLVVDIGGTHVKLMISKSEKRKFNSGPKLSPMDLASQIKSTAEDWDYNAVSVGFPSPIVKGKILTEPYHLAKGWVGFDFRKSLGKPVQLINDAAMQALGSFHGGRMLFLGLGTGLGSALMWERNLLPLELGRIPYEDDIIDEQLGKAGFETAGKKNWESRVHLFVKQLKLAFIADYVVLGGGNSKALAKVPEGAELGHNRNAYLGGCRLWETAPGSRQKKWRVY